MIAIQNVSKSYDGKAKAVDSLCLSVQPGEIFGFLGPNGAGKTTTIKMLTGILTPDTGTIQINGIDIGKDPLSVKRQFGYVPDDPNVFLRLKGIEYLKFMADIYGVSARDRKTRIETLSGTFGMGDVLDDKIQSYSHGMRQKIVIIGALMSDPSVWILDEPMTGLDPKSSFELKNMMRRHADHGNIVFFSTHVLDVAEKVCDKVAVIHKGNIIFAGTLAHMRETMAENESLENMFLEMTESGFEQGMAR